MFGKRIVIAGILIGTIIAIVSYFTSSESHIHETIIKSSRNYEEISEEEFVPILSAVSDDNLTPIHCSMPFVNDGDDVFFWRLPYQHDLYEEVSDDAFKTAIADILSETPQDRILISGRFCEASGTDIFVDYYTADKEKTDSTFGHYDGYNVQAYFTKLNDDHTLGLVIPFAQSSFWTYTGCKPMLLLTKDNIAYLACGITQTYTALNNLYRIDYENELVTLLASCSYDRTAEFTRSCDVYVDSTK